MKPFSLKTRLQWGWFKAAMIGTAIGLLIAPTVKDRLDSPGQQITLSELAARFYPGKRVKVKLNGQTVALAKSEAEAKAACQSARLSYNRDGIRILDITLTCEDVDRERDVELIRKLPVLEEDELEKTLLEHFPEYTDRDRQPAYTLRINDYTVTLARMDELVSVLEQTQEKYDPSDTFQVMLKPPASENVTMYEVEVAKKESAVGTGQEAQEHTDETGNDPQSSGTQLGDNAQDDNKRIDNNVQDDSEKTDDNAQVDGQKADDNAQDDGQKADNNAQDESKKAEDTSQDDSQETDDDAQDDSQKADDTVQVDSQKNDDDAQDDSQKTDDNAQVDSQKNDDDAQDDSEKADDTAQDDSEKAEDTAQDDSQKTDDDAQVDSEKADAPADVASLPQAAGDGVQYVGFSDVIQVMETYAAKSEIKDQDSALQALTTPQQEESIYVIKSGDYLDLIAQKTHLTVAEILELNPGIESDDDLYYDDRLHITVPRAAVQILVEKQETYRETYREDVVYEDDENMFIGETEVVQEGKPGTHIVTDLVTYKDEQETGREQLEETVEVAAIAEIVKRGTKSQPTYMYPVTNWNITSNFGFRWGRLHAGVDVGVPIGTTVRASRAGQVVNAGWIGGYGNCVIIDHGDGISTRYGHLSEITVSVGDYVDQGQQVALSGNTGRSTGPHLHFEVRIGGEATDPMPYLEGTAN